MTVAKSPGAVAAHGAFEIDQLGGTVVSKNRPYRNLTQGAIFSVALTRMNGTRHSCENLWNFPGRNCHTRDLFRLRLTFIKGRGR